MSAKRPVVYLIQNADRRIRVGHQWMFSNEVDPVRSAVAGFKPGEIVEVRDARDHPVGTAYVNPGALIFGRLLSSDVHAKIDQKWLVNRIERALELRERIYREPYYRAIYGEADGLPGLVVDRYGDVLVAQLNSAGTRALRETIVTALQQALDPRGIRLTSAGSILDLEGIPALDETIGEVPDEAEVPEGGCTYLAPLLTGQKTGFYYDQRDNRLELRRYVRDARVLDVYSYIGAWGVGAAKAGAREVVCVDSSEQALSYARRNAERNGVEVETEEGGALDVMRRFALEKRRFDVVVVDPPALVKRKKDLAAGAAHYESINEAAMNLIDRDGFLVSSSCSHHLDAERLRSVLLHAAKKAGKRVQLLERRGHPPDHPVVPAMNESEYLKAWFCRVD